MPYNTRLRGKNPYSVNVDSTKKSAEVHSPTKNKKSPTSATSPSKRVKLDDNSAKKSPVKSKSSSSEHDKNLEPVKKEVQNQIRSLKGSKPSQIKPKANFSKLVKNHKAKITKKTPKRIPKKYVTQKRNSILKNVDVKNLKHVKCVVNSEILSKNLNNTISKLGPDQIKKVLKPNSTEK